VIARGLHPIFGMFEGWRAVLWNPITGGIVFFFIASYFGTSLLTTGRVLNNDSLISAGSAILGNPAAMVAVGIIAATAMAFVDAFGSGVLKRFIIAFGTITLVVWIVMLVIFLGNTPATIPSNFDAVWGAGAYKEIVDIATKNGWKPPAAISWEATSASLMVSINLFYPNNIAPLGGEISKPKVSVAIGTIIAGIVSTFLTVSLAVAQRIALGDFLSMYNFVTLGGFADQLKINLGVTSSVPFFASSLTTVPALNFLASFGPFLILLGATPGLYYWTSRPAFAMAFDRYLPKVFTRVSERWHGPYICTLWTYILMVIFTALSAYYAVIFAISLFALTALLGVFWGLAAICLPYTRPHIWERGYRARVAGVPVDVIFGAITATISWYILFVGMRPVDIISIIMTTVIITIGTVAYVVGTVVNQRRGIDASKIFAEVPPE